MLDAFAPTAMGTFILLLACLILVLAFEFSNGFHDSINATATVIYTNALNPLTAVIWSGLMNFAGVMQGGLAIAYTLIELIPADVLIPADGTPPWPTLLIDPRRLALEHRYLVFRPAVLELACHHPCAGGSCPAGNSRGLASCLEGLRPYHAHHHQPDAPCSLLSNSTIRWRTSHSCVKQPPSSMNCCTVSQPSMRSQRFRGLWPTRIIGTR